MPKGKESKSNKSSQKVEQGPSVEMRQRDDISLPWDQEWLKAKRDDRPLSDQPMPENPLNLLKNKGLTPKNETGTGSNDSNKTGGS